MHCERLSPLLLFLYGNTITFIYYYSFTNHNNRLNYHIITNNLGQTSRNQLPGPIAEISVRRAGVPSWKLPICYIYSWKIGICSVAKKDCSCKIGIFSMNRQTFLEKMVSVGRKNIPSLKIVICSTEKYSFLESLYLFVKYIEPGKVQKKVLLEEKDRYFRKFSRWLLLNK